MSPYLLMIYVTIEQEIAIQDLFQQHGWQYQKKETDNTGNIVLSEEKDVVAVVEDIKQETSDIESLQQDGKVSKICDQSVASENTPACITDLVNVEFPVISESECDDDQTGTNVIVIDMQTSCTKISKRPKKAKKIQCSTTAATGQSTTPTTDGCTSAWKNRPKSKKTRWLHIRKNSKQPEVIRQRKNTDHEQKLTLKDGLSEKLSESENAHSFLEENKKPSKEINVFKNASDSMPKVCGTCELTFETFQELNVHCKSHDVTCYGCTLCRRTFFNIPGLKRHWYSHVLDRKVVCEVCGMYFLSNYHLWHHQKQHSSTATHMCDICNKSCYNERSLKTHIKQTHSEKSSKSVCHVCGKGFNRKSNMVRHLQCHSEDRPFACALCGQGFKDSSALNKHQVSHTGEKRYICSVCDRAFSHGASLKKHMNIHLHPDQIQRSEDLYECTLCEKQFNHPSSLKRHITSHSDERPFKCEYCGKGFKKLYTMREHEVIHTGQKPYKCSVCGKAFAHDSTLRTHKLTHTETKPCVCGICGKSFTKLFFLRKHHLTNHEGVKLLHCEECGRGFNTRHLLNNHVFKEHTEEGRKQVAEKFKARNEGKPYTCYTCGRGFSHSESLNRHLLQHKRGKQFKCSFCGFAFYRKDAMKVHIQRQHAKKSNVEESSVTNTQAPTMQVDNVQGECVQYWT